MEGEKVLQKKEKRKKKGPKKEQPFWYLSSLCINCAFYMRTGNRVATRYNVPRIVE